VGLTIRVVGQATRRGVIPRLPTPGKLLADAKDWIVAEYGPIVRSAHVRTPDLAADTGAELVLDLHPAAEPAVITADLEGRVVAEADTSRVGPGYHTFVARLLERAGEEAGIAWSREPEAGPSGAGPARRTTPRIGPRSAAAAPPALADRAAVERAHQAFLGRTLARVAELRRTGAEGIHVGLAPGTRFTFEGAIATPLGPRNDAWLAQAVGDPRVAADVRPWWFDTTDARYLLNRALVLLWTDVRWRPPGTEAERAAVDEALTLLRRGMPMDPTLAWPWHEWAELIALRGLEDPAADRVMRRAENERLGRHPIGYRRNPVTIVHEGWAIEVPGTFDEQRTAEEWSGGERGRRVTLAASVTSTETGMPMPAEWFLSQVAGDLGSGVLGHEAGEVLGRARVGTDASSGVEIAVLEGFSAVTGRGAVIRIEFEDADDWRWAVDLWRSLKPA
jgi:hypothetical protein